MVATANDANSAGLTCRSAASLRKGGSSGSRLTQAPGGRTDARTVVAAAVAVAVSAPSASVEELRTRVEGLWEELRVPQRDRAYIRAHYCGPGPARPRATAAAAAAAGAAAVVCPAVARTDASPRGPGLEARVLEHQLTLLQVLLSR
jgi:hypothetical protein